MPDGRSSLSPVAIGPFAQAPYFSGWGALYDVGGPVAFGFADCRSEAAPVGALLVWWGVAEVVVGLIAVVVPPFGPGGGLACALGHDLFRGLGPGCEEGVGA